MRIFLEPIIREVGQAIAKEASKVSKRSLPDIISTSVTISLTLIVMVSCVVTAYMYLSENILDRHAMLLVTIGVFLLAVVSGVMTKKIMSKNGSEANKQVDPSAKEEANQSKLGVILGVEGARLIGKQPKNAALIAMAVGVSMGVSPELRKIVFDQILPKK